MDLKNYKDLDLSNPEVVNVIQNKFLDQAKEMMNGTKKKASSSAIVDNFSNVFDQIISYSLSMNKDKSSKIKEINTIKNRAKANFDLLKLTNDTTDLILNKIKVKKNDTK